MLPLIWATAFFMRDKNNTKKDWRASAARFTIIFMELILTSVSKTIFQTFSCTSFDDGDYLDEQLTLPCDDSQRRLRWRYYASFCVFVYPIGVPALMMVVLVYHRARIKAVMLRLEKQNLRASELCDLADVLRNEDRHLRSINRLFEKFVRSILH